MAHVVVTRPAPEAQLWVQQLHAQGCQASALPMIEIGATTQLGPQAATQQAFRQLSKLHALMFVSGNAVRFFFTQLRSGSHRLPAHLRFWAPGPGTVKALLAEGVAASHIDQPAADATQFDSEALWQTVGAQVRAQQHVLIVRGVDRTEGPCSTGHGRQWLAAALRRAGVQVHFAPVYERRAPIATPERVQHITTLRTQHVHWLFSSSESIVNLLHCVPGASWQAQLAVCTHPRIAQQARDAGFGCVIDTKPTVQDIVASIKSSV